MNEDLVEFGFSDEPSEDDKLGCEMYFDGLKNFICNCPTPMTVAIQGGWGTGKTSAMKIIQAKLTGDNYVVIEFNTWKYSKAAHHSLIAPLLMEFIRKVDEVGSKDEAYKAEFCNNDSKEDLHNLIRGALGLARISANALVEFGRPVAQAAMIVADGLTSNIKAKNDKSAIDQVEELSATYNVIDEIFSKLQARIDKLEGKRFVFLIDDLDRLVPEEAVNLLEDMKNIMHLKECVYVLALDNEIVQKGLSRKYGEDIEPQYAERFFDKIIQLPFSLPVAQYDIEKYVKSLCEKNIKGIPDDKDFYKKLVDILGFFRVSNPRTIKRILNILLLYTNMTNTLYLDHIIECSFIIILQLVNKDIYSCLVQRVKEIQSQGTEIKLTSILENKESDHWPNELDPDRFFSYVASYKKADGKALANDIDKYDVERIMAEIAKVFNGQFDVLCEVILATSITSDNSDETRHVNNYFLVSSLKRYYGRMFTGKGLVVGDDEEIFYSSDNTRIIFSTRGINDNEHVNLTFILKEPFWHDPVDPDELKILTMTRPQDDQKNLRNDARCRYNKAIEENYGMECVWETKRDGEDATYLIASVTNSKDNPGEFNYYLIIRGISIDNPESIKLADRLLKEYLEKKDQDA